MNTSRLVQLFGFPATLIHGDPMVLDRWRWLQRRLPVTKNAERMVDIGCGTGAFAIGAGLRGYRTLGLSWNERNQRVARERAEICSSNASFEVQDIRRLDERADLAEAFDVAICFECVEHVLDDRKLFIDIAGVLKPGGRLYLTTPSHHYVPVGGDEGPFSSVEDGQHVRRGYSVGDLRELCAEAGLVVEDVSFCSGLLSQKLTQVQRRVESFHRLLGWTATFPMRVLPPLFDSLVTEKIDWPYYSICLEATKPRYSQVGRSMAASTRPGELVSTSSMV